MIDQRLRRLTRTCGAAAALCLALGLTACGKTSNDETSSTGSAASEVAAAPPASGCGSYAAPAPADPDGVLATMPSDVRASYAGYHMPIRKSAWSDFQAKHPPPYDIAINMSGLVNALQVDLLKALRADLAASELVGEVDVYTTGAQLDIPQQLQNFSTALRAKPDLIITQPLQPEAFVKPIAEAAKAGVPVVTFLGEVDTPYALNINSPAFQAGAQTTSIIARQLGGKGRALYVHGFPTSTADVQQFKGFKAVLENCPGLELVGEANGNYVQSQAKAETLKFLATHPGRLDAVVQGGGMGNGVLNAFLSSGRDVPALGLITADKATMAYWAENRETLQAAGTGQDPEAIAAAAVSVALRTLEGDGPKVNNLIPALPLISEENLDEWSDPAWKANDLAQAPGPPDEFMPEPYLDELFEQGAGR